MPSDAMFVGTSVDELVRRGLDLRPLESVGKSGARLERITIDSLPFVVKHLDRESDWTMRASGFDGFAPVELWRRGILRAVPACSRQPIVAVAEDTTAALLMEDVSPWLVPSTDDPIPIDQNERFLDHMAQVHAAFWSTDLPID